MYIFQRVSPQPHSLGDVPVYAVCIAGFEDLELGAFGFEICLFGSV